MSRRYNIDRVGAVISERAHAEVVEATLEQLVVAGHLDPSVFAAEWAPCDRCGKRYMPARPEGRCWTCRNVERDLEAVAEHAQEIRRILAEAGIQA